MLESGPKFEVPRVVWLFVYGAFVIVAAVPLLITMNQIPESWNESMVNALSRGFVCVLYGSAVFKGADSFVNWLFGPYSNPRPVESPPA